ncbi:hypothetical protein GCM10020331_010630 [Ectobacillus funiculus]
MIRTSKTYISKKEGGSSAIEKGECTNDVQGIKPKSIEKKEGGTTRVAEGESVSSIRWVVKVRSLFLNTSYTLLFLIRSCLYLNS